MDLNSSRQLYSKTLEGNIISPCHNIRTILSCTSTHSHELRSHCGPLDTVRLCGQPTVLLRCRILLKTEIIKADEHSQLQTV